MARRPNYGFEKRQKEIDKQKKKELKEEGKKLRKEAIARGELDADGNPIGVEEGAGDVHEDDTPT